MTCVQRRILVTGGVLATFLTGGLRAEAQVTPALTLPRVVEIAMSDQPNVVEARARAQAAANAIGEARAAYLPHLDALWQVNRASYNNVFGLLFPQSVIPPVSGPVLGTD